MSEWISAKDRLPASGPKEEFFGKAVIVCLRGRDDGEYEWNRGIRVYGLATITPDTGDWKHWYIAGTSGDYETEFLNRNYEVTHWMQLPELPEETI